VPPTTVGSGAELASATELKNPLRLQEVVDERVCALVLRKKEDGREGPAHWASLIPE
jgi:hypothetical protein